ncbi:MAG: CPBP family intramembrane glutamic endopeptidase [Verrucomicrobiales bacterium]
MKSTALQDAFKVILYLVLSLLFAALFSPLLYQLGKGFGQATIGGNHAEAIHWLAKKALKHDFDTYFNRALMLGAVLFLYPLLASLRLRSRPASFGQSPWSIYLPAEKIARDHGQPLTNPRFGWLQALAGFLLAAGILFAMGWLFLYQNWFRLNESFDWQKALSKAIPAALGASLVEEFIFRGALLGIFIRAFRPLKGTILLSLIFAFVHFLQPAAGHQVAQPAAWHAGFDMLRLIGLKFLQPQPMLYSFTTLFLVGLILGQARYATASLWLPIGLHAGWVFSFKLFNQFAHRRPDLDPSLDLFIGRDLKEGLLPLAALTLTGLIVWLLTRKKSEEAA